MKIAVNTRLLLKGKLEGIGWYTHQTLKRIVLSHPEHEFIFFFDRKFDESFIYADNVKGVTISPQARHPFLYYLWFEWLIPYYLKKYKVDVFLSPDGLTTLNSRVPSCLVIHDLAFEHFPEHKRFLDGRYYRFFTPRFARKAKRIVTVSEFSKQDIFKQYGVENEKISVSYNGAHSGYRPLSFEEKSVIKNNWTSGQEYFIFAGALHPRKNVVNLLKAFIVFKRKYKTNMKLVIVGRMAWKYDEVEKMKNDMPFREDVIWTGYLDVQQLSQLMGAAYALVYASLFEGFGIPILEALQCHVPVIASNTSSMPEVAGAAGLLVDPYSYKDIAEKMGMLYKDELMRKKLIAHAPAQVERFTWEKSAAVLWENVEASVE